MALERVAFLPFGLLIDKWRWEVFQGDVSEVDWNDRWWQLRQEYQGIVAPSQRPSSGFDPGAKYHVPANSQYIGYAQYFHIIFNLLTVFINCRYFFAHLLEFEFYKSLCIEAGEYNPDDPKSFLHQCDFYENLEAGKKLRYATAIGLKISF